MLVTTAVGVKSILVSKSPSMVVDCIGCRTLTSFLEGAGWYVVVACRASTGKFRVDGSVRLRSASERVEDRDARLWNAEEVALGRCRAPEEKSH